MSSFLQNDVSTFVSELMAPLTHFE